MITFHQTFAEKIPAALETSTTRRMANAMRELFFAGRTVDREALMQAGFTRQEIAQHNEAATDLANSQAVRSA